MAQQWTTGEHNLLLHAWEDANDHEPQTNEEKDIDFHERVAQRFDALCADARKKNEAYSPRRSHKASSSKINLLLLTIITEFISAQKTSDDGARVWFSLGKEEQAAILNQHQQNKGLVCRINYVYLDRAMFHQLAVLVAARAILKPSPAFGDTRLYYWTVGGLGICSARRGAQSSAHCGAAAGENSTLTASLSALQFSAAT